MSARNVTREAMIFVVLVLLASLTYDGSLSMRVIAAIGMGWTGVNLVAYGVASGRTQ